MFDLPARFKQDEKYYAVRVKTRSHFRHAERQELRIQQEAEDGSLKYSEQLHGDALDPLDRDYIGFVSRGIYSDTGVLKADTLSATMASVGRNQKPRKLAELSEIASPGSRNNNSFSSSQQHAVVLQAGFELLPRSAARPIVRSESAETSRIALSRQLSANAQEVLERTNYRCGRSLAYPPRSDVWSQGRRMLRRRGMQVVASLMWTSLDRGDYERAYSALAVLLRSDGIIMRNLWMPAVELLAWKESQSRSSRTPTAFLDWLIVNFPTLPAGITLWQKVPRAEFFRPIAIMSRLAMKDYRGAMAKAEEAMVTIPSSSDPLCWALAGLTALKMQETSGSSHPHEAEKYFKRCIELGGVLPQQVRSQVVSKQHQSSLIAESDFEQSETESDLELDGSQPVAMASHGIESELDAESAPESAAEFAESAESAESDLETSTGTPPRKRVKLERGSENLMAANEQSDVEPGIKQEPKIEVQSQASTLGASWTDSEEEDF